MSQKCTTAPPVILTDTDNGKTIVVSEGNIFEVKLKAQLGTGYGWQYKSSGDKAVLLEGKNPKQVSPEKLVPGGFEFQVFSFKAKKQGKEDLSFEYRQPWNKGARALKTYRVTVDIK